MGQIFLYREMRADGAGFKDIEIIRSTGVPLDLARVEWLLGRIERQEALKRELEAEGYPCRCELEVCYDDPTPMYFSKRLASDDHELRTDGPQDLGKPGPIPRTWVRLTETWIRWETYGVFEDVIHSRPSLLLDELHQLRCCLVPDDRVDEVFLDFASLDPVAAVGALENGLEVPAHPQNLSARPKPTRKLLTLLLASPDGSVRARAQKLLPHV